MLEKQILYRSCHRGCKETDFLLGNFFTAKLASLSQENLELARKFLEEDDLKIYDWILGKELVPEHYLELVDQIRQFHQI